MRIFNKKARFNYKLLETHEAGVVLTGAEVKAIKAGKVSINQAHVRILGDEVYLVNANINVGGETGYNPTRSRKLLLKRKEINELNAETKAKNLTLVPVKIYTARHLVKVQIALAKHKRKHQKKEIKKKRDVERDLARELKEN